MRDQDRKIKVVLLALTGFGNPVLEALIRNCAVKVEAVFTVKYDNPFPYYDEDHLQAHCAKRRITCYCDVKLRSSEGLALLSKHSPDLIIVATFKQILSPDILDLPPLGVVNLHPSLLPRYRGPCPTNAVLLNDEEITGVTAHYVVEKLDEGDVLCQRSISIHNVMNDGDLRRRLARLSGEMVPDLIQSFTDFVRPVGTPQNHEQATLAPRPLPEDGYLEQATDISTIRRKMRAFNPLPGTSILVGNRRVAVNQFELRVDNRANGVYDREEFVDVVMNAQAIRLFTKS